MKKYLLLALTSIISTVAISQTLSVNFIATSPTTMCEGDTVWLQDVSTTTGGSGVAMRLWETSSGFITIDDPSAANTFFVCNSGSGGIDYDEPYVKLSIQDSTGAYDELYQFNFLHIDQPPVSLTANATNTTICYGDTTQLLSGTGSDWMIDSWSWSPTSGVSDDTLQNPFCYPSSSVTYTVAVTNGVCSAEANVAITVNPLPPVPTITNISANDLQSSAAAGNQWYFNSSILSGEINQVHTAANTGVYNVTVTDVNGCVSESLPFNHTYVGLDELSKNKPLSVYPNPVQNELFIDLQGFYSVTIFNTLGEIVEVYPEGTNAVNVESLNAGMYFVHVNQGGTSYVAKIKKM